MGTDKDITYHLHTFAYGDIPVQAKLLGKTKSGKRLIISYRHKDGHTVIRHVRPSRVKLS
jgi:hypothetical protein